VGCPATDGALWIHVLDDAGDPVPSIEVNRTLNWGPTDNKGLVKRDPLSPDGYDAVIEDPIPPKYDPPARRSKPAQVIPGQVSYVLFTLVRRASLRVQILYEPDAPTCDAAPDERPFTAKPVTITWKSAGKSESRTSQTGEVVFEYVTAGAYDVMAEFAAKGEAEYEITKATSTVDLEPGPTGVVKLHVAQCYTKVRFIGHCLLTIPKQSYDGSKWTARYNGLLKDHQDMQKRVELVSKVMDLARDKVFSLGDDQATLKVMVVPECYFQGKYGAYQHEIVDQLIEKLQNLTAERKWKDWLFVFGTVNSLIGDAPDEMVNIAPVIRGGHCYTEKKLRRRVRVRDVPAERPPHRRRHRHEVSTRFTALRGGARGVARLRGPGPPQGAGLRRAGPGRGRTAVARQDLLPGTGARKEEDD
jgi:hypothetical protein